MNLHYVFMIKNFHVFLLHSLICMNNLNRKPRNMNINVQVVCTPSQYVNEQRPKWT